MHEFSLVEALIRIGAQHVPPRSKPISAKVVAGPLRGIDPDSMQWAWRASIPGTVFSAAALCLEVLPWLLECRQCGQKWESADPLSACACGNQNPILSGSDELKLVTLECDD